MRDIFSELIGELDKEPSDSSADLSSEEKAAFTLPEGARHYLPDSVWDKLTEDETPRRGILLNALERVRSVLYLISTYLPSHVVQQKMRRPVCGLVQGREVSGTLLFSDVSGFTALSERLAVLGNEGAEQLTQIMNGYFENMLEILAWSGGSLLKFAGDATLVYFAEQKNNQQAQWAVRTGQRMMAAMTQFQEIETPLGAVALKMKIGISTGRFLEAHIGSSERMEYIVLGPAIRQTMAAEGTADAGMVVLDETTARSLAPETYDPHGTGFFIVRAVDEDDLGDFELKAESRRARGSIPWNANPHAIAAQMDVAVRQINCLTPYLAQELVANIVTNARQRRIASEFRPTTVIFCNFTGFEAYLNHWGQHGPRRVATILSQFFQAMHQIIDRHGGVVTRIDPYSSGSKMLILFGAPTAHEDDPQRAAGAAIAMRARLVELNGEWRQLYTRQSAEAVETAGSEIEVQLKIGITHGRTFAGQVGTATRREYTVMGDDVNLSARLMGAAQPGQILINEPVYRAVAAHFQAQALEPIRVKGKSSPIPIFELREKRTAQSYQDEQPAKPVFGRYQELAIGREAIYKAVQGQGRRLQIQGAAGIGKSHLADAFYAQSAKEMVDVRHIHCHSFTAQSPYAAWISFVRNLAAVGEMDSPDSASRKLAELLNRLDMNDEAYSRPLANLLGVRIQPAPPKGDGIHRSVLSTPATPSKSAGGGSLFSQLGQKVSAQQSQPGSGLDLSKITEKKPAAQPSQLWQRLQTEVAARERARLFEALLHLLRQTAAQKPLLLFFENAQWLDPASQELLGFVGQKLAEQPILILSIHREPFPTAEKNLAIELGTLSLTGTAEMVNHLRGEETEAAVIEAIHGRSGGNPLFIREMVYWLERKGQNGRSQDLAGSLKSSMTIQELILSRVDSLPIAARETLKVASIIGDAFGAGELEALLKQQKKEYALDDVFGQLEGGQIIAETALGEDSAGERRYAFQQPLVREIVYNSQSFAKRRQSHGVLADYLEKKYGENVEQQAELLAYHFEQAENWAKGGYYSFVAAQRARQRYAYDLAAAMYGQALAVLTRVGTAERTPETITLMAQCHEGQGDMALLTDEIVSAAFAYRSAVNLLMAAEQTIPVEIQIKVAQTRPVLGKVAEAVGLLRGLLERPLPVKHETAAAASLVWLLWRVDEDEARTWLKRAKRLAGERPNDGWAVGVMGLLTEWEETAEAELELYSVEEVYRVALLFGGDVDVAGSR